MRWELELHAREMRRRNVRSGPRRPYQPRGLRKYHAEPKEVRRAEYLREVGRREVGRDTILPKEA